MSKDKDEQERSSKLKVVDKRLFSSDGSERNEESSPRPDPTSQQEPHGPSRAASTSLADGGSEGEVEYQQDSDDITLSSFVMSLATQALMQLGEIKGPPGIDVPVDREAAKQTIDILSMLEKRFKSGLEPAEFALLEEVLHNLRVSFVKRI